MTACLNLDKEKRPDISEILKVATQMHTHFQAIGSMSPMTPSPAEMSK